MEVRKVCRTRKYKYREITDEPCSGCKNHCNWKTFGTKLEEVNDMNNEGKSLDNFTTEALEAELEKRKAEHVERQFGESLERPITFLMQDLAQAYILHNDYKYDKLDTVEKYMDIAISRGNIEAIEAKLRYYISVCVNYAEKEDVETKDVYFRHFIGDDGNTINVEAWIGTRLFSTATGIRSDKS